MRFSSMSDLLAQQRFQSAASRVTSALSVKGDELSTGLVSDKLKASGGDLHRIAAIDAALKREGGFERAISLATGLADGTQAAIGAIRQSADAVGVGLLAAYESGNQSNALANAADARGAFEAVVSSLNASHAGRRLFAGASVSGPALADPDAILADVLAATASATTAQDVIDIVEDYFTAPGGGFETNAYLGSSSEASSVEIADGERVRFELRADDMEFRQVLSGLALSVVAVEGGFAGGSAQAMEILGESARSTLSASSRLLDVGAAVGVSQERLAQAEDRSSARRHALDLSRSAMLSKDPYEAASEFQALESQLDSMFTVTARMSRLSLTSYLR